MRQISHIQTTAGIWGGGKCKTKCGSPPEVSPWISRDALSFKPNENQTNMCTCWEKKDFFPPKIGKIPTVDGHSGAVAEVAGPQPLPPPPPRPKDPKRSQRLQKHKPLFLVISDECWSLEWRWNTSADGPH